MTLARDQAITLPRPDPRQAVLRALLEGAAGVTPLTGFLARLYQTTHPSAFERALEAWRAALSDEVQSHAQKIAALEARFEPALRLSALAVELADWLVRVEGEELGEGHSLSQVQAVHSTAEPGRIEEALHELTEFDLVAFPLNLGGRQGPWVRPRFPLFWLFEPSVTGVAPLADAELIARLALTEDQIGALDLMARNGWSPRRVATALAVLEFYIPEGHKARPANPSFPLSSFWVDAGSRMRLRRFLGAA